MPTYQYRCQSCDELLEVVQSFTDDALTVCPECNGALRKVFNSVGVVFKGSGFYRTDSRNSKSSTTTAATTPAKSDTASTPTPDSKPAASTPTPAPAATPSN